MESCNVIKSYCKAAQSGYYYIGGRLMINIYKVFCEMQADGGKNDKYLAHNASY